MAGLASRCGPARPRIELRVLALHIRDTRNAGDRWSCPLDYFDLPGCDVTKSDMRNPPVGEWDMVVYGGGSITSSPDFRRIGRKTVAWGVGHHVRQQPWAEAMRAEHERAAAMCDLYFPRDRIEGMEHAPCASCMHPVFDSVPEPDCAEVRYSAHHRVDVSDGIAPHMTNEDGSIEDAVRFLSMGARVVTSSYHGAYWARLIGREVRVVPWGSKFSYLTDLSLEECREANRRAHRRVLGIL